MEIKIDKDTGVITAIAEVKTAKGGKTKVAIKVTDPLEVAKRLKEAAYLANRLKKINTWDKARREKALAELGF